MPDEYRKRAGRFEEWHFHPDCPDWPRADYIHETQIPRPEELCLQCIGLYGAENSHSQS